MNIMAQDSSGDKIHNTSGGSDFFGDLLSEQGIQEKFEPFDTTSEGKVMPGGGVNESGYVLLENGRIFAFWLNWDPEKLAPDGTKGWYTLGENFKDPHTGEPYPLFREVLPDSESYPKPDDLAFLEAKKKLGLK